MKQSNPVLAACLALGFAACGGGEKAAAPAPAETQAAAPAPTAAAAPAATGAAEFGVPECDEYLTKYAACIDGKLPAAMKGVVQQQLDQTKAQWKQAASTPQGKAGLATGCKAALDAAKAAMQAYGCQW